MKKIASCGVALIVAGSFLAADAAAAERTEDDATITWSVSPATDDESDERRRIGLDLGPGQSATDNLAVTNHSDAPVTFQVTAHDGYVTRNGTFDLVAAGTAPQDVGAWILVDGNVTVDSEETAIVPFSVEVPEDARPGDHVGGVAVSVASEGDASIGVDHRIGVRVNVHVPGDLDAGLTVSDVTARYAPNWNPFEPGAVIVEADVTAVGNLSVDPMSHADVAGPFGLGARSGRSSGVEVLPGNTVHTTTVVRRVWPWGRATADLTITPLTVDDAVDVRPETIALTVPVWAMPWPQLLAVLLVGLAGFGLHAIRAARRERLAALLARARAEGAADAHASQAPAKK